MSTTFSYLYLDSRHRNNQSDDDGRANFSLSTPLRSVVSAELVSASIPVSWYTIAQGKNTFELTHSGSTTTITITEGVYTLTTLATAVQSAINTASARSIECEGVVRCVCVESVSTGACV